MLAPPLWSQGVVRVEDPNPCISEIWVVMQSSDPHVPHHLGLSPHSACLLFLPSQVHCPLFPRSSSMAACGFHSSMVFFLSFLCLVSITQIRDCEIRQAVSRVLRDHERGSRPSEDKVPSSSVVSDSAKQSGVPKCQNCGPSTKSPGRNSCLLGSELGHRGVQLWA